MAKPSKDNSQATPAPEQADEFAGIGGSYLIDADGKKTLVERTKPAEIITDTNPE